jgi:hypothetical protein
MKPLEKEVRAFAVHRAIERLMDARDRLPSDEIEAWNKIDNLIAELWNKYLSDVKYFSEGKAVYTS